MLHIFHKPFNKANSFVVFLRGVTTTTTTSPKTRIDIENIPFTVSKNPPGKGVSSLVESSLLAMELDQHFKVTSDLLRKLGRQHMTTEEQKRQRRGFYFVII